MKKETDEKQELRSQVESVLSEVERTHRYSMSRIYALYNKVFGTSETPQSCASCLIRKVRQLKTWLETQAETKPGADKKPKTKKPKQK